MYSWYDTRTLQWWLVRRSLSLQLVRILFDNHPDILGMMKCWNTKYNTSHDCDHEWKYKPDCKLCYWINWHNVAFRVFHHQLQPHSSRDPLPGHSSDTLWILYNNKQQKSLLYDNYVTIWLLASSWSRLLPTFQGCKWKQLLKFGNGVWGQGANYNGYQYCS